MSGTTFSGAEICRQLERLAAAGTSLDELLSRAVDLLHFVAPEELELGRAALSGHGIRALVRQGASFNPVLSDAAGGYRGRTGIYELVVIDDVMRGMIHDGAGEHDLERHARTQSPSIRDDGRSKVLAGTTSLEELLRVTSED